MKKNIQIMIEAAIQMLHTWRKSIVFSALLLALCLLENFSDQWHSYEMTSDVQLALTRVGIMVAFSCSVFHVVLNWPGRDGYHWWRILGYVAGWGVGCVILLLARELIWSFTNEGFLKGWACFAAATIPFIVLQAIVGWRGEP